jgi:hypothetical protein
MIERGLVLGARAWRVVAGQNTALERRIKRRYRDSWRVTRRSRTVQYSNQHGVVVSHRQSPDPKVGVFLKGGCDLPSMFLVGPLIAEVLSGGSVAIVRPPEAVGSSQSAQVLQTRDGIPREVVEDTCRRLDIRPSFFRSVLFEKGFDVAGLERLGTYPKSIVVLSIASDLTRSLHRHREHGFLVDIGGWWLNQSLDRAIKDVETVRWFRQNFEPVGRIGVEEFARNTEQIIRHLSDEVGARVIVFNSLVVEPSNPAHNYQLLNEDHFTRRREFNVVLAELSARLDFHVLDVDRILKQRGVVEQVDFAHFPVEGSMAIAREGFRIMRELEVI